MNDDERVLLNAGLDPAEILKVAARYVSTLSCLTRNSGGPLCTSESVLLEQAGASIPRETGDHRVVVTNTQTIAEFAVMVTTGLNELETANYLGVSQTQVQQRRTEHQLFSVDVGDQIIYPKFQFDSGLALPNLSVVLSALNGETHPVAVQRFFIYPNNDLVDEDNERVFSPRDWLIAGRSAQDVVTLIAEL